MNPAFEYLKPVAIENLRNCVKNGEGFMAVAFIQGDKEMILGLPFKDDEQKIECFFAVGELCAKNNSAKITIVIDSYIRSVKKEDSDYLTRNWATERPSTYPESMRQSALAFMHFDVLDAKNNEMLIWSYDVKDGQLTEKEEYSPEKGETIGGEVFLVLRKGYEHWFSKNS